jgi:hypothetical protein
MLDFLSSRYLPLLMFLLSCVVSLYPNAIRRALAVPPNKARGWWKSRRLDYYTTELAHLKRLHNNAYELLLFVLIQVGSAGLVTTFMLMVTASIYLADLIAHQPFTFISSQTIRVDIGVFLGIWTGSFARVFVMAVQLTSYEPRVSYMETKVAELTSR